MSDWFSVENEADLFSPALLLFRERIEQNLALMLEIAGGPGRLRPHVKTHKLGSLVRRQIELGITKFKCATIAEAEMAAEAGAADVMLAHQPVGPTARRLVELIWTFPSTTFSAIVDDADVAHRLGSLAAEDDMKLGVWLDVDCGMGRTGIAPGLLAEDLYRQMCQAPGLQPRGLHVYDGHITDDDPAVRSGRCDAAFAPVVEFRQHLESRGLPVPSLAAGGTPTFPMHARATDGRECSPGTTVLWDFGYGDKFADLPFRSAAVLLTRVISHPSANRLCLDLGHKALAAENPHPRVRLLELPDAEFVMHSEEHLVVESPHATAFRPGQCLHGIPRHVCPTVALHAEAIVVDDGSAIESWPILARGRRISV